MMGSPSLSLEMALIVLSLQEINETLNEILGEIVVPFIEENIPPSKEGNFEVSMNLEKGHPAKDIAIES